MLKWQSQLNVDKSSHFFIIGDLRKLIVNGFVKGYSGFDSVLEYDVDEEFSDDLFAEECENVGCCDSWLEKEFYRGYLNAGFFVQGSRYLGLGTFLANFANLTAPNMKGTLDGGPKWSVFNLDQQIMATDYHEICQKMSDNDRFLQEYFTDLGVVLGFSKNSSLSLFDLPSMLSSTFESEKGTQVRKTREIFVYSQCKMNTLIKASFHQSFNDGSAFKPTWLNYFSSERNSSFHPCSETMIGNDGQIRANDGKYCNFWTTQLQHELKPIMKVCIVS